MKVLVTAASRHGATGEIAQAIGDVLAGAGHDVTVAPPEEVIDVGRYGAVVVGSAVYAGHWLPSANQFVHANAGALEERPVWLFSSGPFGDPPKPAEPPVDAESMMELTAARSHQVFGGRLERKQLGFAERAIVRALRAPDGDDRDWDEVRAWAEGIAIALSAEPHPAGT